MNLKYKTIFSNSTLRGLLLSVGRVVCIVGMAYYMGQAIASGVNTLGAIIYSLFPVLAFGGILLLLEIQKGSFASLFSLPALSDIKVSIKYLPFFIVILIGGVLLVFYSGIRSPVDLVMILLVIMSAGLAVHLMLKGRGVEAICVFILAWPIIIFEQGGRIFFYWNKGFAEIIEYWPSFIVIDVYICLLISAWFIKGLLNRQHLVAATWSPGIYLYTVAGALSVVFSSNVNLSITSYITIILMPVLFFVICVNEVRSLNDFKKLSLALGVSMGLITLVWLYYALYRNPQEASTIAEFASLRGGGGKALGSPYEGRNGIYYEYLCPLVLPSVLALSFTSLSKFIKRIWLCTALLMIGTSIFTFGRVGWVALLICLLPWFWHLRRGRWLFISLFSSIVFASFVIPEYFFSFFHRFKTILDWEIFQTTARYTIWKGAWQMFLDNPWAGIGMGMFREVGADYDLSYSYAVWRTGYRVIVSGYWPEAHSAFFQVIATMGIPGLIAWCFLLWIPVRSLIMNRNLLPSLSAYERPWAIAVQSYTIVIFAYIFVGGGLGHWGIETLRTLLFFLMLAVVSNRDIILKDLHLEKLQAKTHP
ncbi:MAG: O-antigen ligase family protein [Candidatus Scalindua sp.]